MLTTKEFIKEVKKLGLEVRKYANLITIYYENEIVARVNNRKMFFTDTLFLAFDDLSKELKENLYNLVDEYARTPLEDREKPQRFYLRFTALTEDSDSNYLNYYMSTDTLGLCSPYQEDEWQTEFTQKEIDDIKKRFGVTLSDFEQIPVDEYCEEDEEF